MKAIKYGNDGLLSVEGVIFNIQRYSIHDGTGIRTIVFLKGCPLRCIWCANPESQPSFTEVMVVSNNCIGCGKCLSNCPAKAILVTPQGKSIIREKCNACGLCVKLCVAECFKTMGRQVTVEEVLKEIESDDVFYRHSDGGLTLSGGEPFLQANFTYFLLRKAKERGLGTVVETCGFAPFTVIEQCLPYIDQILYDIKHFDSQIHKSLTGVDNSLILENAEKIAALGTEIIIRVPIIPGINDSKENLTQIVNFAKKIGVKEMHLLPYHEFGRQKYSQLGKTYELNIKAPTKERMEEICQMLNWSKLHIQAGG